KKSKVLYVQYKEGINQTFLRNLDLVCVARKTIMVVDPLYSFNPKYSFKSPDSESDLNYLQSFLNGGIHNDHRTIGNARRAFLENSMIQYGGLIVCLMEMLKQTVLESVLSHQPKENGQLEIILPG